MTGDLPLKAAVLDDADAAMDISSLSRGIIAAIPEDFPTEIVHAALCRVQAVVIFTTVPLEKQIAACNGLGEIVLMYVEDLQKNSGGSLQ